MQKDFDKWNTQKKKIDYHKARKNYHAGDIWWIRMGLNIGFEQDGKGTGYERPCLVIKGFNKEVCLIVPLSTVCKHNRFYVHVGLVGNKQAYAIISQIRLIDTKRLVNKIDSISRIKLKEIKKAIWDLIR